MGNNNYLGDPNYYMGDSFNKEGGYGTFGHDLSFLVPSAKYLMSGLSDIPGAISQYMSDNDNQQKYNDTMAQLMNMNPNSLKNLQQARLLKQMQMLQASNNKPVTASSKALAMDEGGSIPGQF